MGKKTVNGEDPELILKKIRHYCSYHERSIAETERKLEQWHYQKSRIPSMINRLQQEGYLDEERFARVFAGGKFRINKWGKRKIEYAMRLRGLPELMIQEGLAEIGDREYRKIVKDLISRKLKEINPEKNLNFREKIINFALGKGYEINLILEVLKELKS